MLIRIASIRPKVKSLLITTSYNYYPIHPQAVGEPPLFLAGCVFFAIKDAIRHARVERGHSSVFDLMAPATGERIRMACEDQFTQAVRLSLPNGMI